MVQSHQRFRLSRAISNIGLGQQFNLKQCILPHNRILVPPPGFGHRVPQIYSLNIPVVPPIIFPTREENIDSWSATEDDHNFSPNAYVDLESTEEQMRFDDEVTISEIVSESFEKQQNEGISPLSSIKQEENMLLVTATQSEYNFPPNACVNLESTEEKMRNDDEVTISEIVSGSFRKQQNEEISQISSIKQEENMILVSATQGEHFCSPNTYVDLESTEEQMRNDDEVTISEIVSGSFQKQKNEVVSSISSMKQDGNVISVSATQDEHNLSKNACVDLEWAEGQMTNYDGMAFSGIVSAELDSTEGQMRNNDEVTTSANVGGSSQKQQNERTSPISNIKQEGNIDLFSVTEEEYYAYFSPYTSSAFNIKRESFGDQEQNSCNVIPTTSRESCVASEKQNDYIILPTSSIDSKFTRADKYLGRELGVSLTGHQLMKLEQEFSLENFPSRMRRVEISRKLQLSEKQVTIWFQNRRLILRKYGEPIPQIVFPPERKSNTSNILNEIPQKQEYGCISPTRSIKRKVSEIKEQNEPNVDILRKSSSGTIQHLDDRIISSAFNVEQESIEDQEQNSCAVMLSVTEEEHYGYFSPCASSSFSIKQESFGDQEQNSYNVIPTTSRNPCVVPEKRNDNIILPTPSIDSKFIRTDRDLGRELGVSLTGHQLMELEKEFSLEHFPSRMRRVEISRKLELSEKQVTIWFQNRRLILRKNGEPIPQIILSPTRSIKREAAETDEHDDRIISSAFNVEQKSIEDQEQNSCAVMLSVTEEEHYEYFSPCASSSVNIKQESFGDQEQNSCNAIPTTSRESCVVPEKRNYDIILPIPSIDSKFARADRDLGRELGVFLTGHQLMELEQEFNLELFPSRMRRVEISRKLQLSEKQVTIWFQNRRLILRKYGEPMPQIVLSPGKQNNTSEISNEIPQKQEYGCISPTRSIKREVAETEEQDDRIISSAFNVEQESIKDQEQNSCAVMPSVAEEERYRKNVVPEKRNGNIILPTSSNDSKFARADRDIGRELGVFLTGHQLMELEQEFNLELFPSRMRRVEISRKLQLSEKQVTIWFQNRRLILRKYGEPTPQIVVSPEKQSNTSEILNEIPQKQEYGCISPTRSIKREMAKTEEQDDRLISSAFNVELESIEGQEQNSCAVMPTTSKESCEAQNERNDNSNLPTSRFETTIAGAEEQNKLDLNNLVANRDLGQRLRVTFTKHQLMILEQEFSVQRFPSKMKRVEISDKLQLSEKQVKFWFQNRRMKSKKNL